MRLAPGAIVADRYRLTRLLGEGGMGDVWEATHAVTGRAVAIKRLRLARDAEASGVERARFVLEAQAACAVEHPNVVQILDFIEAVDEPPIIVMELLRGETLAARLEREQVLDPQQAAQLLVPAVSAVGTAHARGIVHRDLKPANIFLQETGEGMIIKVLDFGIAKWMSARPTESMLRTETGSTLGTPCYMAPEQALGERVIDHRADVWALGVILYECLSGMRPVEGENAARIMVRLMSTGIMPIERLVPSVPAPLARLVTSMLSREPADRPCSLGEVQTVLLPLTHVRAPEFGEPRVDLAQPSSGLRRSTTAPPLSAPVRTPRADAARARSRFALGGNWLGMSVAAIGLAAAGWGLRALSEKGQPAVASAASGRSPAAAASLALASTSKLAQLPAALAEAPLALPGTTSAASVASQVAARAEVSRLPAKARGSSAPRASSLSRASAAGGPAEASASRLAAGAACERSRDCESRLCLAFICK